MPCTMKTLTSLSLLAAFAIIFFIGCKKSKDTDTCAQITQVKITGAKSSYYVGDTISLGTNIMPDALFSWNQSNALNEISNTARVFIYPCTKDNEGWYWLAVNNPDCPATHFDSVYIKVISKAVTPPCSPGNNSVSFSSIPSISFGSASWQLDPSWNCKVLSGYQSSGYPDISIYFNPYWNSKEPEDGEYDMASTLTFPDNNVYTVFIASVYSSVYFAANPGKVYVNHVNGKMQVTFCGLTLTGSSGGPTFKTTATGRLTAP